MLYRSQLYQRFAGMFKNGIVGSVLGSRTARSNTQIEAFEFRPLSPTALVNMVSDSWNFIR
jgi:hypothetical protein